MKINAIFHVFLGVLLVSKSIHVSAQSAPSTIDPGRQIKQFEVQKIPAPVSELKVPGLTDLKIPKNASDVSFTLRGVELDGMNSLEPGDFSELINAYKDKRVNLADVYTLANQMTAKYRQKGLILSQAIVPEQGVPSDGVVRFTVVEGHIDNVSTQGATRSKGLIDKTLAGVASNAGDPLELKKLERALLLTNDLPGVSTIATLKASDTEFGGAGLLVQVAEQPIQRHIGISNRGSDLQGPTVLRGGLAFNQLTSYGTSVNLNGASSLNDELTLLGATIIQPITASGLTASLGLLGVDSEIVLGDAATASTQIDNKARNIDLGLSYPLIRTRKLNTRLSANIAQIQTESVRSLVNGVTGEMSGVGSVEDEVTTLSLGVDFDFSDALSGVNLLQLAVRLGETDAPSQNSGATLSRVAASDDFVVTNIRLARVQTITERLSLLAEFSTQISSDQLLSSQQFAFGGENIGRPFDSSEIVGDEGWAVKLELRYFLSLPFLPNARFETYLYYDQGETSPNNGVDEVFADAERAGFGLGTRFQIGSRWSGYLEYAVPTDGEVAVEGNDDARFFASIAMSF